MAASSNLLHTAGAILAHPDARSINVILLLNEILARVALGGDTDFDPAVVLQDGIPGALADLQVTPSVAAMERVGRGQYVCDVNSYGAEVRFSEEPGFFDIRFVYAEDLYGCLEDVACAKLEDEVLYLEKEFPTPHECGHAVRVPEKYIDLVLDHVRKYREVLDREVFTWDMVVSLLGDIEHLGGYWVAPQLCRFHTGEGDAADKGVLFEDAARRHCWEFRARVVEWPAGAPATSVHFVPIDGESEHIVASTGNIRRVLERVAGRETAYWQ